MPITPQWMILPSHMVWAPWSEAAALMVLIWLLLLTSVWVPRLRKENRRGEKMHDALNWKHCCYCPAWLCSTCNGVCGDKEHVCHVGVSAVRLRVPAIYIFHIQLSHPLRMGQGGMLSEPKCPSFLQGAALPGNKTKTTGFHSMKQSARLLLWDLPWQSIEISGRQAGKQKPSLVLERRPKRMVLPTYYFIVESFIIILF